MLREPDPAHFRQVFGHFPTGVAVITSSGPSGSGGLTANAVCSLSLEPMLALVAFDNTARTLPIVRDAGRFAINVLRAGQDRMAGVFASKTPEAEKLEGVPHTHAHGVPLLTDALAWVVCDVQELLVAGDHTIAIGAVTALDHADGDPLLWYRGSYRGLNPPG